jgi:hypothetical protein
VKTLENYFDIALICKNGHLINSSELEFPSSNTEYCKECGAKTIDECKYCNSKIQGAVNNGFYHEFEMPNYCHKCGKPYPWTEERLKALNETIDIMDELSSQEKLELKKNIQDITTYTPRTTLAALKIKKVSPKIGKEIWNSAKEIIIQVGTETALKSMGLK